MLRWLRKFFRGGFFTAILTSLLLLIALVGLSGCVGLAFNTVIQNIKLQEYTITLNAQEGSGGTSGIKSTILNWYLPKLKIPKLEGKIFCGYYTEPGGKGVPYYTAVGLGARMWDIESDTILYAYYREFPFDGEGTKDAPYLIATAEELTLFAELVNYGNMFDGVYWALKNNIDLDNIEWTPIGTANYKMPWGYCNHFAGVFDGQGFSISNFSITNLRQPESIDLFTCSGLFGYNFGNIKNLGVVDFNIDITYTITTEEVNSSMSSDIVVGGLAAVNNGNILNCYTAGEININVLNTVDRQSIYANTYGSGFVGFSESGTISNCNSGVNVKVNAQGYSNSAQASGFIASLHRTKISNSYSTGTVNAVVENYIAYANGFVGHLKSGEITNCYALGNIDAIGKNGAYAGGFLGVFNNVLNIGNVTNCYALGNVNSISEKGEVYAGGFLSKLFTGEVIDCYATGDVSVASSGKYACAGGFVGTATSDGKLKNCFATGSVVSNNSENVKNGYAGGFIGYESRAVDYLLVINNCYKYSGQIITGIKVISAVYDCSAEELNGVDFYINKLKWNASDWTLYDLSFIDGKYVEGRHPNGGINE